MLCTKLTDSTYQAIVLHGQTRRVEEVLVAQLRDALKEYKAKGFKINVSGNVRDLRLRLQDCRNGSRDEGRSGGTTSSAGDSSMQSEGSGQDACAEEDMPTPDRPDLTHYATPLAMVTPTTMKCLEKLDTPIMQNLSCADTSISENLRSIDVRLRPIKALIDAMVDCTKEVVLGLAVSRDMERLLQKIRAYVKSECIANHLGSFLCNDHDTISDF